MIGDNYRPTNSHTSALSNLPIVTSKSDDFFAHGVPSLKSVVLLVCAIILTSSFDVFEN